MHKLAELCIRRPVFATMLVLALTVIGAFSFFSLGVAWTLGVHAVPQPLPDRARRTRALGEVRR